MSMIEAGRQRSTPTRSRPIEIGPVVALFVVATLVFAFGALADEVREGSTAGFDRAVLMLFRADGNAATPIGPPWVQEMGRDVTALGSFVCLGFLTAATVGYLLLIRKRALAGLMVVAVLGGTLISTALKLLFDRPRPDLQHSARVFTASFPSGHATLSAITFLTLAALLARVSTDRRVKLYVMTMAVLLTLVVGTSRVYLGVHFPTDVLAGWCVGSAWAIFCWAGALWLQRRGGIEPEDPASDKARIEPTPRPARRGTDR